MSCEARLSEVYFVSERGRTKQVAIYEAGTIWGVHRARETPDPIPNSEVKPRIGDGTAGATLWESSTMPLLFFSQLRRKS